MVRLYDQNIWGNFARTEKIGNRNQYILGLIKEYAPDFCAFQECNPSTSRSGDMIKQVEDGIYVGSGEPIHTIDYMFTYAKHLKALKFAVDTFQ